MGTWKGQLSRCVPAKMKPARIASTIRAVQLERMDGMPSLTRQTAPSKSGILSDDTTIAILQHYLRAHGATSEARLEAVLQAAKEAVVSLTLFLMTMQGQIVPERNDRELVFSNTPKDVKTLEPIGPILRRVLAQVTR
jgi:hypothetical protein